MVLIESYTDDDKKVIENPTTSDSEFGRLHFVKSSRKIYNCRICSKEIQLKDSCFRQSINNLGFFPVSSRVCLWCAKTLINEGTVYVDIEKEQLDKLYEGIQL